MVTIRFWVGKLHNTYVLSKGAHSALVMQSFCFIQKRKNLIRVANASLLLLQQLWYKNIWEGLTSVILRWESCALDGTEVWQRSDWESLAELRTDPVFLSSAGIRAQQLRSLKQRNTASSHNEKPSGSQAISPGLQQQQLNRDKGGRYICPLFFHPFLFLPLRFPSFDSTLSKTDCCAFAPLN